MSSNFDELESKSAQEILAWAAERFDHRVALAASFGLEDMVIIDMISKIDRRFIVFTLDTGRLHEETYDTMERVRSKVS